MKSKFSFFFLLFLLAGLSDAFAQQVSGIVRDAQTQEPLEGATLIQAGTQHGTTTNSEGAFQFRPLGNFPITLEIRYVGYAAETMQVNAENKDDLVIDLYQSTIITDDLIVEAFRLHDRSPVTYSNISKDELAERNLGMDIPQLLEMSPSVISSSDAGAGIGYTGLRIRGVDPQRINVTINGIPLNDSESHGVFWVNIPDIASSLENIQLQRGVGTSSHGPAAFGATVNLQTTGLQEEAYAVINSNAGSFNTFHNNIQAGTGLLDGGWVFDARLSRITSDGYIDRAWSNLRSFFVSGARHGENSVLKMNVFSGREKTYQAWYGVNEQQLGENRRYNPAGRYTDPEGQTRYYDNQTDNYTQTHYQLHYSYRVNPRLNANVSLHYTRGAGYYEEYRGDNRFVDYGLSPVMVGDELIERSDLIRQRWLDNHFGGATVSAEYQASDRWKLILGGGYNYYEGDHFGKIIWARTAVPLELGDRYYDNVGKKSDGNVYVKSMLDITDRLSFLADIQLRFIDYELDGINNNQRILDDRHSYTFLNPRTGLTYDFGNLGLVYGYFGVSGKEPVRRDFTDATENYQPKHETLYNWEAGYRGAWSRARFSLNFYYMLYDNQLINTGDINDVGDPVRTNVGESYRAGVEAEGSVQIAPWLQWGGNIALSRNRIPEFIERIDVYDDLWAFAGQEEFRHTNTDIAFSPSVVSASRLTGIYRSMRMDWYARYVGRQYLDNTSNTDRSLSPYFVQDLRLSLEWNHVPFADQLHIQVLLNNVFNHTYESNGYTFGYFGAGDEYREVYYFPQAGRHVLAGVSVHF
ncbi:TonB-dependent receptor [Balneolaceae bacterium ANBcel3]|nr:TonB-dependent receptor [Balneolaceae bacterium ANBcel3]